MSGPRAVKDLLAVWLAGLPMHEMRAFNELALALAFAKEKAELLPPSIDRRCASLINTKLDEAEHWMLDALRTAVDRSDELPCANVRCSRCGACTCAVCARARQAPCVCPPVTHACGSTDPARECCGYEPETPDPPCTCTTVEERSSCNKMCEARFR